MYVCRDVYDKYQEDVNKRKDSEPSDPQSTIRSKVLCISKYLEQSSLFYFFTFLYVSHNPKESKKQFKYLFIIFILKSSDNF